MMWDEPPELGEWVRAEAERRSEAEGHKVTVTDVLNGIVTAAMKRTTYQQIVRAALEEYNRRMAEINRR